MRLSFVSPAAYPTLVRPAIEFAGGAEFQQIVLARALRDRGHDISFIVGDYGQEAIVEVEGMRLHRSFELFAGSRKLRFLSDMRRLRSAIRASEPDFVNQRSTSFYTGQCCRFAHEMGAVFAFSLGIDYNCYPDLQGRAPKPIQWLYRWGIEHAELVWAQTHAQAELMARNFRCSPRVLRNMLPLTDKREPGEDGSYVLWVGSLARRKRPEMFVELARRCPSIRFALVGGPGEDAGYDAEIQRMAESLPNLELKGFVPPAKMEPVYRAARVYVNTSELEGFPNTYLQSWAQGVPTLTVSVDPDGLIESEGLGARRPTLDALAGELETLWSDPDQRREMGARARRYVEREHDVQAIAPRVEEWIQEAVGARS